MKLSQLGGLVPILAFAALGCSDAVPSAPLAPSRLVVSAHPPSLVAGLVVEVSGPGISPAVLVNLPVDVNGSVSGSLELPAGSARRVLVTAQDSAGIATHRADTTMALPPGANVELALTLRPIPTSLGLTVTFGNLDGASRRN